MQIKFTKLAQEKLFSIHSYISQDSVAYADRFIDKILIRIKELESFSNSGRKVPELNNEKIREIIIKPYRVIYLIEEDISILNIIHSKQNFN